MGPLQQKASTLSFEGILETAGAIRLHDFIMYVWIGNYATLDVGLVSKAEIEFPRSLRLA